MRFSSVRSALSRDSRWRPLWATLLFSALLFLLLTVNSPLPAQDFHSSGPPQPISNAETLKMRLDLSTLIAQRDYWKDRSDNYEKAATMLSARLAILEQSLKDSPDPQTLLAEIADIRLQLQGVTDSLATSNSILESLTRKVAEVQAQVDKAQATARVVEAQLSLFRGLAIGGGAVIAAETAYIVGHLFGAW